MAVVVVVIIITIISSNYYYYYYLVHHHHHHHHHHYYYYYYYYYYCCCCCCCCCCYCFSFISEIECATPHAVNNAVRMNYSTITYLSTVEYRCFSGYIFNNQYTLTATCNDYATWEIAGVNVENLAVGCNSMYLASCLFLQMAKVNLFMNYECFRWFSINRSGAALFGLG